MEICIMINKQWSIFVVMFRNMQRLKILPNAEKSPDSPNIDNLSWQIWISKGYQRRSYLHRNLNIQSTSKIMKYEWRFKMPEVDSINWIRSLMVWMSKCYWQKTYPLNLKHAKADTGGWRGDIRHPLRFRGKNVPNLINRMCFSILSYLIIFI